METKNSNIGESPLIQIHQKNQPKKTLISYSIYKYLVSFLSLKDVHNLSLTCKQQNSYQMQYFPVYALHLYRHFLSDQIKFPLEIHFIDYPDFLEERQKETVDMLNETHDQSWLDLLKQLIHIKNETSRPKFYPFLDKVCEYQCPRPIMKRENVGIYCETEHQNILALRIELEQKGQDKLFQQFPMQNLMKNFKDNKKLIIGDTIQNANQDQRDQILRLRWYLEEEQKQKFEQDDNQVMQPLFIHIFQLLVDSIDLYTQAVSKLLQEHMRKSLPNAYELLVDYCVYWQAYSNSILEMQQSMMPLEQIINELYGEMLPNLPQYPKFSFWRLMTKKWLKNIYYHNNFDNVLQQCLLSIIKERRNQLMLQQFQDLKPQKDEIFQPQLDYITKELYDNFVNEGLCYYLKQKDQQKLSQVQEIEFSHPFYSKQPTETDRLIQMLFQSIQDISLTEVSVHWLGHTDCQYEYPFFRLQEQILKETSIYYEYQCTIFKNNLSQYIKFLEWDLKYLTMITNEILVHSAFTLQKEHLFNHLSNILRDAEISPFLQNNTQAVAKIYQFAESCEDSLTSPKKLYSSTVICWLAEQNQDIDEEEPTQQIFNFMMEHPNVNIQEEIILQKLKNDPDLLTQLIKYVVQDQNALIEFALQEHNVMLNSSNSSNMSLMLSSKDTVDSQHYLPEMKMIRTLSQLKKQELIKVPDELVKLLKLRILENEFHQEILAHFSAFCIDYERSNLKFIDRDYEIVLLNENRQVPKVLAQQVEKFYSVNKQLQLGDILQNALQVLIQYDSEKKDSELEVNISVTSKNSDKILNGKQMHLEQFEEYFSEEEEMPELPKFKK